MTSEQADDAGGARARRDRAGIALLKNEYDALVRFEAAFCN